MRESIEVCQIHRDICSLVLLSKQFQARLTSHVSTFKVNKASCAEHVQHAPRTAFLPSDVMYSHSKPTKSLISILKSNGPHGHFHVQCHIIHKHQPHLLTCNSHASNASMAQADGQRLIETEQN